MKIKNKLILLLLLSLISGNSFCQLLETRNLLSVTAGVGTLKGNDNNLFFPSSLNHSGLNVDVGYRRKITSWLAGGLSLGYNRFSSPTISPGFAEVVTSGGTFITAGPQVIIHSPYKSLGILNRLRLGIAITPQFHYYSGERSLLIDNEVLPVNGGSTIQSNIVMDSNSLGFGAKLSPEINLRITQRFGLKLAYNLQLLNVFSGYDTEALVGNSFLAGMIFTFGHNKLVF